MPIVKNCIELCHTPRNLVCKEQVIEGVSLWRRYSQLRKIIDTYIDVEYRHFLAQPVSEEKLAIGEEYIYWFIPTPQSMPIPLSDMGSDKDDYKSIFNKTIEHYQNVIAKLKSDGNKEACKFLTDALMFVGDYEDTIYCYDDKVSVVLWSMCPRNEQNIGSCMVKKELSLKPKACEITFDVGDNGITKGKIKLRKIEGTIIKKNQIPVVVAKEGWKFIGWNPDPEGAVVLNDDTYVAQYKEIKAPDLKTLESKESESKSDDESTIENPNADRVDDEKLKENYHIVRFYDKDGNLLAERKILDNAILTSDEIPFVKAPRGRIFKGWSIDPLTTHIVGDTDFYPSFCRGGFWGGFNRRGCLSWLLWILLGILLLGLLIFLLRSCGGCSHHSDDLYPEDEIYEEPINDDPNYVPIPPNEGGVLPPEEGIMDPINDDDIINDPIQGPIVGNRINILMENDNFSVAELAKDLESTYTSEQIKVVYFDNNVKRLQLEVNPNDKERLMAEIPEKMAPKYELFVYDEAVFGTLEVPTDPDYKSAKKSWYLHAINASKAWDYTKGDSNVIIAVVDNGFTWNHPELKDKIVKPYNTWTRNSRIYSLREDHGTHVSGIAVGAMNNGEGLCGIAPNCKLMPVQVANEDGLMTTTMILDGILFSIYQGADVVNVSLGKQFPNGISLAEQKMLQNNAFKGEERVWNAIMRIADKKNVAIVIAAGNENMLAGLDPMNRPDNFIIVSATDRNNQSYKKASFSNFGEYSTVSAPGEDIYNCYRHRYATLSGTSMSAPIVTGAVALMKSLKRDLPVKVISCILQKTGIPMNGNIGNMIQLDKALQMVKDGSYMDCFDNNDTTPIPSTGDVQILLNWNNTNDLDLICTDPNDDIVWYGKKSVPSGGLLEIDMNCRMPYVDNPIENIYWPHNGALKGTYKVEVLYYKYRDQDELETSYSVKVKAGNNVETYEGILQREKEKVTICEFTL